MHLLLFAMSITNRSAQRSVCGEFCLSVILTYFQILTLCGIFVVRNYKHDLAAQRCQVIRTKISWLKFESSPVDTVCLRQQAGGNSLKPGIVSHSKLQGCMVTFALYYPHGIDQGHSDTKVWFTNKCFYLVRRYGLNLSMRNPKSIKKSETNL